MGNPEYDCIDAEFTEIPSSDPPSSDAIPVQSVVVESNETTPGSSTKDVIFNTAQNLFSKLYANELLRKTFNQKSMELACKLIAAYDAKHGPGAAKNSTEIIANLAKALGGDTNKAAQLLERAYEVMPSTEQVMQHAAPIPEPAFEQKEETQSSGNGPVIVTDVPEPTPAPIPETSNGSGPVMVDSMPVNSTTASVDAKALAGEFASELLKDPNLLASPDDLNAAVESAKPEDVVNADAFRAHVLHTINEANDRAYKQEQERRAAKTSLQRWEESIKAQHSDVQAYAQSLLDETYNLPEGMIGCFDVQLGAYTVKGLAGDGKLRDELHMNYYSNPVFAIIRNINSEQIKACVDRNISAMSSDEFSQQINAMLETSDITHGESVEAKRTFLLETANSLPQLKGRTAPDNYKLWYVLTRFQGGSSQEAIPQDMSKKIFEQTESAIDYQARTEDMMAKGVPQGPAMDMAYKATVENLGKEEASKRGLLSTAGHIIGTVAATPAKCKKSVDDAMYEAMGEYGDEWRANKQAAKERKEQLKDLKRQQEFELKKQKIEADAQRPPKDTYPNYQASHRRNVNQRYGYNDNYGHGRGHNIGGNRIPYQLIVIAVGIILALLLWIIKGATSAIVSAIGVAAVSVGLFMHDTQKKVLICIGGAAVIIISFFL